MGSEMCIRDSAKGIKVALISCGQVTDSCAAPAAAARDAARRLGWDLSVYDGKLDPSQWNAGIRQAIAAHADAIVLDSVDCGPVRQSLQAAHQANIKVYAFYSFDCSDPAYGSASPLFDGSTNYGGKFGTDYGAFSSSLGEMLADYAIAQTGGRAKVIEFNLGEIVFSRYARQGFERRLASCSGCKVVQAINYVGRDLGPPLTAKAQSALLQHPDANVVVTPADVGAAFVAPAVKQLARKRELIALGGEGLRANLDLIRNDSGEDMVYASPPEWIGWAAIDGVNRLLHDQEVAPSGIGGLLIDRDDNLPPAGQTVTPKVDFRAAYATAWGLDQ